MDECKPLPLNHLKFVKLKREASFSLPPSVRVTQNRVTRYDPISIWEIDMEAGYGTWDINGIST